MTGGHNCCEVNTNMTETNQLLTEYLENISGKAIEEYQEIIRESIRGKNGIYALYKEGELVYVGLATDLLRRLDHHLRDRHKGQWDTFSVYITRSDTHLRELESFVMRIAYPPNNRQTGRLGKAVDLRRDFENAIDAYFEAEKETFFSAKTRRRNKQTGKNKVKFFKERKVDMVIVPAREDGFKRVFLGENCWYEIRLSKEKIKSIHYIAAYQIRPISAITHFAKIQKIEEYKNTGKYKVFFKGSARKIQKPIRLGSSSAPQGPIYSRRELLRGAKELADLL